MRTFLAAAVLALATPAHSEVVSSGEHGFEVQHSAIVPLAPAEAMSTFARIDGWWSGEHTYSGSAANLALALQPGGCFCERLPNGGGVEHMRVAYVDPGKRLVLTGSLGPLLYLATTGVWDVQFTPVGTGSRVSFNYRVAGFASGGAEKVAALVDRVILEQIGRYVVYSRPDQRAP